MVAPPETPPGEGVKIRVELIGSCELQAAGGVATPQPPGNTGLGVFNAYGAKLPVPESVSRTSRYTPSSVVPDMTKPMFWSALPAAYSELSVTVTVPSSLALIR